MRKFIVSLCVLGMTAIAGYAQGIVFETGTFAQALEKAKQENKLVFIDFYTTWCTPCKVMSADVFTRETVGSLFNSNFVNIKIDAEKGEGIELAKKYQISAFPTMLWVKPDGTTLHTVVGARNEEQFLAEANILKQSVGHGGLEQMKKIFAEGNNDPAFLLEFYNLFPAGDKMRPAIALRYLQSAPDEVFFDMTDDAVMMRIGNMFSSLDRFDEGIFNRLREGTVSYAEREGQITAAYNISVVFPAMEKVGKLMEAAINSNNREALEKLISYKESWPAGIVKNVDPDWDLLYGRGIFFASGDFLRLEFMRVNELDDEFAALMSGYMENMMRETPKGTWVSPHFDMEYIVRRMQNATSNSPLGARTLLTFRSRSIDYLSRFVENYWRVSPSDSVTKERVALWLDYILALNPYYTKGIVNSTALLIKVGQKDMVISKIENSINLLKEIHLEDSDEVRQLQRLLKDVINDKVV